MENKKKRSFPWKERFAYWFDNRVSRGSLGLIRLLIAASVILAVGVAALIVAFGFQGEEGAAPVFWDSVATVINAWMPSYEDGGPGYLVLMSVVAVAGLLFTSVLIGIVTSAIEERIIELKKGNSRVLEQDHTVILGFYPGQYTLLRQLVLAAGDDKACLVIADETERDEMETAIRENVETPKNVRIVCRTADITDPAALEKLSIDSCRSVIVSPTDDARTVKAVLAVAALMKDRPVPVNAILDGDGYRFPPSVAEKHAISALQTNDILARIIAHSCTQTGLSATFREVFDFDGSELYLTDVAGAAGLSFAELTARLDRAVPAGIRRDGRVIVNPPADTVIREGERILVFSEERESAVLAPAGEADGVPPAGTQMQKSEDAAVILGRNESLKVILRELPENVVRVYLSEPDAESAAAAQARGLRLETLDCDPSTEAGLKTVGALAEHVVILNDHDKDEETADLETMFTLLRLRDLRERCGLRFNITAELRREADQALVAGGDHTDFVVTSSMSSMFLARLAENPELIDVFREILSNDGNELYLKDADALGVCGGHSVRALRAMALRRGYILLGFIDSRHQSTFNPPLDARITLTGADRLIVLGEK